MAFRMIQNFVRFVLRFYSVYLELFLFFLHKSWVFFLQFETIESISIKINYTWNSSASREFGKELAWRAILKVVFCHLTAQVLLKKESKWLFLGNSWVSTQKVLISCCKREIIWAVYVSWGAGDFRIVNAYWISSDLCMWGDHLAPSVFNVILTTQFLIVLVIPNSLLVLFWSCFLWLNNPWNSL